MGKREYHRFGGDELWQEQEIKHAPETARRIALALGPGPIEDARHLLPPVPLPPPFPPLPEGPLPAAEFIVDLTGRYPVPRTTVLEAFPPQERGGLGFAHLWVKQERPGGVRWLALGPETAPGRVLGIALSWELASLLTEGTEAIAELAGYVLRVNERAVRVGLTAIPRETPEEAVHRAAHLIDIRTRFARNVEVRLLPAGRSFPARAVWRGAYALGLRWGDLDLFHWHDPATGLRLFSLNAIGHPGYFLPERAAEGEGTLGIALSFELPRCPAPVETFDRMSVALAFLRQHLGGRPQTSDGQELDAERLDEDRDTLREAVHELSRLGFAPGSPVAGRFF